MSIGHAHGRDCCVDHVYSSLRCLERGSRAHTGSGMGLHGDGNGAGLLQTGDQIIRHIGLEQACHVLDADRVAAHVLKTLTHGEPVL